MDAATVPPMVVIILAMLSQQYIPVLPLSFWRVCHIGYFKVARFILYSHAVETFLVIFSDILVILTR